MQTNIATTGWSVNSPDEVDKHSGAVTWESARDLSNYVKSSACSTKLAQILSNHNDSLTILELGCGSALPSLTLMEVLALNGYEGSVTVHLQDMDEVTIESVTKPHVENVISTLPEPFGSRINIRYIVSSWEALDDVQADIILSSECIYREDLFTAHAGVIERSLPPHGIALLAAKRYYFGCGGGTIEFSEFLASNTELIADLAEVFENGVSNTREILLVHR